MKSFQTFTSYSKIAQNYIKLVDRPFYAENHLIFRIKKLTNGDQSEKSLKFLTS